MGFGLPDTTAPAGTQGWGSDPADTTPTPAGPIGQFSSNTTMTFGTRTRYTRIYNPTERTIDRLGVLIATSSGNIDLAVYDGTDTAPANRLVSLGSTASPGTGVRRFTCASTVLPVGWLWLAVAADNGTFATRGIGAIQVLTLGLDTSTALPLISEGVFPCPAVANAVDTSFQLAVVWAELAA